MFPGQPRKIVLLAWPESFWGPPTDWTYLEHLTREASRSHPNKMREPPHVSPLDAEEQWLLTLSLRETLATLQIKLISAACTRDLVLSITT